MITRTADGSVVDNNGKVLFFSVQRFVDDICLGDCCFICGRNENETEFNREHVLPRWVLRRYQLLEREITLPNDRGFRYGQYMVPCCSECNTQMSELIETPISSLIANGIDAVSRYVAQHGLLLFFIWLSLIYLKTHLKDRRLRFHRDQRQGTEVIGNLYDWTELHHVHCVARSFYTGAQFTEEAMGSIYFGAAKIISGHESFDYFDLYDARSVMIRLDDVFFVAVLNDSNAAYSKFVQAGYAGRITGALSPLQLREVFSHFAFINSKLKYRPVFSTQFDQNSKLTIVGQRPSSIELEYAAGDIAEIFYACVAPIVSRLTQPNAQDMLLQIKAGRWTFLFDESGHFLENQVIRPPASEM